MLICAFTLICNVDFISSSFKLREIISHRVLQRPSGDLFLLVGRGGDGAIRIHYGLGTAHHCHQQEETQEEEEKERKAQVHVHLKLRCRLGSPFHVCTDDDDCWSPCQFNSTASSMETCAPEMLMVMKLMKSEIQIKKKMEKGVRMTLSAKHRHFKSYGFLVANIHFIQKCAIS